MTLINILVATIIFEATGLMAAFPTMIETARKTSREARMFEFRNLAGENKATELADFIEHFYSDNKVVFLKMTKGVLLSLVFSSSLFLGSSYYVSSSVVPNIRSTARQLGFSDSALATFEPSFNELPNICLFIAWALVIISFFVFLAIGFYFDLPHDVKNIINPPRQVSGAGDHGSQS